MRESGRGCRDHACLWNRPTLPDDTPQGHDDGSWGKLRGRLAKFALELHPGETRLIEVGPRPARLWKARGEGKPETFTFLGSGT